MIADCGLSGRGRRVRFSREHEAVAFGLGDEAVDGVIGVWYVGGTIWFACRRPKGLKREDGANPSRTRRCNR